MERWEKIPLVIAASCPICSVGVILDLRKMLGKGSAAPKCGVALRVPRRIQELLFLLVPLFAVMFVAMGVIINSPTANIKGLASLEGNEIPFVAFVASFFSILIIIPIAVARVKLELVGTKLSSRALGQRKFF